MLQTPTSTWGLPRGSAPLRSCEDLVTEPGLGTSVLGVHKRGSSPWWEVWTNFTGKKVALPRWCCVGFSSDTGSFSSAYGAFGLGISYTAVILLLDVTFREKPPSFSHSFEFLSDHKALLPCLRGWKDRTVWTLGTWDKLVKATCPCWTFLFWTKPQAIWQRGEGERTDGAEAILQLMHFGRSTADKALPLPSQCHIW